MLNDCNMSFALSAGQEKCRLTSSLIINEINSLTPNDLEGVYLKHYPSLWPNDALFVKLTPFW